MRIIIAFLFFLAAVTPGSRAATNIVTSAADLGAGSLRQVLAGGSAGDTVIFTNTLSGQTLFLTNGELALNYNVTIDASGLAAGIRLDGLQTSRIFNVGGGISVTLKSLTITNGYAGSWFPTYNNGLGAGIYNGGNLTLSQCCLVGNAADGGSLAAGAIYNTGTLTVNNCTITKNSSRVFDGFGSGGIFAFSGSQNFLNNCTVVSNSVSANGSPGAGDVGGFSFSGTTMLLTNSIVGNIGISYLSNGKCLIGGNALLAPLRNYGGPTASMVPLPGSPAVDAGDDAVTNFFALDQRGLPRKSGVQVDIGAVEVGGLQVVNTLDSGAGSLRQCVSQAAGAHTLITFAPALSGQTILLTSGQLNVISNTTIDASALAAGIRINGNQANRIFNVASGVSIFLNALTLTNGSSGSGGAINNAGNLMLNRCSLVGNFSSGGGGAIASVVTNSSLTLVNCTIAKNTASWAGAIWHHGGSVMNLLQCTIVGNTGTGGSGGLVVEDGPATLQNSIVATNSGSADPDIGGAGGALILAGNNFIGQYGSFYPLPTGVPNTNGQFVGSSAAPINPLLAPLGNYGGPTPTLPPLLGSLVIDSGSDAVAAGLSTDQRGFTRQVGAHVDIGAVELTAAEKINGPIPPIRWMAGNTNWDTVSVTWADVVENIPINYTAGRNVLFDDLASGTSPILVTNTLTITNGNITFNNTAVDYFLAGPGAISNNVPITKLGTGTITIATTNNLYGGTFNLGAGKLVLPLGASLGSAASGALIVMSNTTAIALGSSGNTTPAVPLRIAAGATVTNTANALGTGFNGDVTSADATAVINDNSSISYGGNFQGFTGTLRVNSGTTRFSKGAAGATDLGSTNASFVVNGILLPRNNGCTVHLGSLSGSGTLGGVQTLVAGTTTTTFSIGANNGSGTFSGSFIQSVLPPGTATTNFPTAIVKVGTGTLTLSGVSTNTGATTVNGGMLTLVTGGSLANSAMTVANGATNSVTIASPGSSCSVGNLTYAAGTNTLQFDFGTNAPSAGTAPLQVQNNVVLTGSTLNVVVNGSNFSVGTYPLISYAGTLTGTAPTTVFGLHAPHFQMFNDTANKRISLQVVTPLNPVVVNTNDSGAGSLRQAVADTRDSDTIRFTNALAGQTIVLTSGQIILSNSVIIDGSAIAGGMKISANNSSRLFLITNASPVLTGLQLLNGSVTGDKGGCIFNSTNCTLTVSNCTLANNSATGQPGTNFPVFIVDGGPGQGGAVYNAGTLLVVQSTMASNSVTGGPGLGTFNNPGYGLGGAIFNDGSLTLLRDILVANAARSPVGGLNGSNACGGAVYHNNGQALVSQCLFSNNVALGGDANSGNGFPGGSGLGGAIYNRATQLTIFQSTLTGNAARGGYGGNNNSIGFGSGGLGGYGYGGAAYNDGVMTVSQSTLAGDTANGGAGGFHAQNGGTGGSGYGGAIYNNTGKTLTLVQSTIAADSANGGAGGFYHGVSGYGYGGGLYNNSGTLNLTNSIIAGNTPDDAPLAGISCVLNVNPQLSPLANYGGLTPTMPPLLGSPAIDAGTDLATNWFATDQRGLPFPALLHPDCGAAEIQTATAPGVAMLPVNYFSSTSVGLNATVTPNGAATTYFLVYGLTTNYDQTASSGLATAGATNVSAVLSGLSIGAVYHYTCIASNNLGVVSGTDSLFVVSSDNFNTRLPLAGSDLGNNSAATLQPGESSPTLGIVDSIGNPISVSNTVWWTWTAPTNSPAAIQTGGSSFDTIINVFTGNNISNLTLVAGNLPTVLNTESQPPYVYYPPYTNVANAGITNRLGFTATAGTTYQIQISGLTSGNINLAIAPVALKIISVTLLTTNGDGSINFNATIQAGNCGATTPGPLRLLTLARAGYSVDNTAAANGFPANPPADIVIQTNFFTLAPGATTNIFVSGVCPGPTTISSTYLGYGWGIMATLEEQFLGNWFFKDGDRLFYGTWPNIGGFNGPGGGVARINPGLGGGAFVAYVSSAIIGPTLVAESSTNSYYASVTLTGPQTIYYTNSVWMASAFTINTNGKFQTGKVTTNTPAKLVSFFNFNGYDYSNQLSVLVLKQPTNSFSSFALATNRVFSLNLNTLPGAKFAVDATTNLGSAAAWTPLATNVADANGNWKFTDSSSTNCAQRFYRGRKVPGRAGSRQRRRLTQTEILAAAAAVICRATRGG